MVTNGELLVEVGGRVDCAAGEEVGVAVCSKLGVEDVGELFVAVGISGFNSVAVTVPGGNPVNGIV